MIETRWHEGPINVKDRIICKRCRTEKGLPAFPYYQRIRLPGSGKLVAVERDVFCRRCRNESARGVPDQIVALRTKELKLSRELKEVRKAINALRRGTFPEPPRPSPAETAAVA